MIKNKILIPLVILITLGFNLTVVNASHIVGGEMTYRCLGNGTFEISLTVYRDCFFGDPRADFDDPAWIGIFRDGGLAPGVSNNGILTVSPPAPFDTLREVLTSDCFVQGDPVCVERAVHRTTVQLPFSENGYILSYQRCCRNQTIKNIVDPDMTGANIWCYIPSEATQVVDRECNSNPVFNDYPPIYLCTDDPIDFDHSATDIDGDELVYSLCTPQTALSFEQSQVQSADQFDTPNLNGDPFDPVIYSAGYDLNDLLGGSSGIPLAIDPNTGLLTGVPTDVGQFLVGVCVSEYRNGELLSETRRDFQFNVRSCEDAPTACIDNPEFNCESLEVAFANCSEGNFFGWNFGDGSTSVEVSPTHTYEAGGKYLITLVAYVDSTCTDTAFLEILVNDIVGEDLLLDSYNTCNGDVTISVTPMMPSVPIVLIEWSFNENFDPVFTGPVFTIPAEVANGQIVYVRVTDENGCEVIDQAIINTTITDFSIVLDAYNTCNGTESITATLPDGIVSPMVCWSLSPDFSPCLADGVTFTDLDNVPENAILYVRVEGDGGCTIDDQTVINRTIPDFSVVLDSYDTCDEDITEITATLPTGIISPVVDWSFNIDFDPIVFTGLTFPIPDTLTVNNPVLYVRVTAEGGCTIIDSTILLTGTDLSDGFTTNDTECGSLTVQFTYLGDPDDDISWDFGDMTPGSDETNPSHTYDTSGTYIITITAAAGTCSGEPFIDTITVVGPDIIDIDNENILDCDGQDVILNPGGNPNYNYVWSPADSLDNPNSPSPTANVSETTVFTVVVSDPDNADCNITETVTLTLSPLTGVTFSDRVSCDGDEIELNPNNNQTLDYMWSPAELFGDDVTNPNPTITVTGSVDITVIVSDPNLENCLDTFMFNVSQIPAYDVTVDTDVVQCPGGDITITTMDNDTRMLTFEWYDIDFNGPLSTDPNFTTTITESTCFYLVLSDQGQCPDTTKINATLDEVIPVDVEVMNNRVFCQGEQVTLNITSDIPAGATITWSAPGSGSGPSTTFTAESTVTVTATVTSELGCPFTGSALVEVSVFVVGANAQPGCVMTPDEIVQLGANPNAVSYSWTSSPPVEISDPTIANPTATGLTQNTTFTLDVVDENGCPFQGMTQVVVQEDCTPPCLTNEDLPNLFSPNDDGINDQFVLSYGPATLIEIFIYDRWGNQVFNTTSPAVFWDGLNNGNEKPQDVYGYLIIATCPDGQEIEVGGNVTLFR